MKLPILVLPPLFLLTSLILSSCDQKGSTTGTGLATPTTAELAREAEFMPWQSRAGLQVTMEQLLMGEHFSAVEGRLHDGENQYRAIRSTLDREQYALSKAFWGLTADELYEEELACLRKGFQRSESQVFTDSTGQALHQLVMVLPQNAFIAETTEENEEMIPETVELPAIDPKAEVSGLDSGLAGSDPMPVVELPETPDGSETEIGLITPPEPVSGQLIESIEETTGLEEIIGSIETPEQPVQSEPEVPGVAVPVEDPEAEEDDVEPSVSEVTEEIEQTEPVNGEANPAPTPTPTPKAQTYKVRKGDSLSKIAREFGVSVQAIKKTNGLRSDMLRISQVLKIPTKS